MDYENLGVLIAQEIVREQQLDLATPSEHRYRMELFMAPPENPNSYSFYQGIMQVLQPYIDSGVLVIPSGRYLFEDACALDSSSGTGLLLCQQILSDYYAERWPDIIITGDDPLALGCILALEGNCPADRWPIISGLGGSLKGAKRIVTDKLKYSSYFDTTDLVDACLQAVDSAFFGQITAYEETRLPATVLHKGNYEEILLEGGIYTSQELFE
jgi:putative multiple sugar transport system substrate-binding protein